MSEVPETNERVGVSRRDFLVGGAAAGIAVDGTGSFDEEIAAALDGQRPQSLAWRVDTGRLLAQSAHVIDDVDAVVTLTSPLVTNDESAEGEGEIVVYDLATGDRRWREPYEGAMTVWSYRGTLYQHSADSLAARDPASGEIQWSVTGLFTPPIHLEDEYAVFSGLADAATVVNLSEGTVRRPESENADLIDVVATGDGMAVIHGDSEVVALDLESEERVWTFDDVPDHLDVDVQGVWPLGFVESHNPDRTVVLDLPTGEVRWTREQRLSARHVPSMTAEQQLGPILATDDGTLSRLAADDGAEVWSRNLIDGRILVHGIADGVALVAGTNQLWAVDAQTGEVRWSRELMSPFPMAKASRDGDTIYAAGTDLFALDAEGTERWQGEIPGDRGLGFTLAQEHVVVVDGTTVYTFDRSIEANPPDRTETTQRTSTTEETTTSSTGTDEASSSTTTEQEETVGVDSPGFGVLAALLGAGGLTELLRRLNDNDADGYRRDGE